MIDTDSFLNSLTGDGSRTFMVRPEGAVSYGELGVLAAKALGSLQALRLPPGERIAIIFDDEAKACAVFVASFLNGQVPVMLPHDIGAPRLQAIRRAVEPALIAQDDSIFSGPEVPLHDLPSVPRDSLAYLLFTSGTTAAPSGVEITRGNLFAHLDTLIRLFGFGAQTRVFNPTPIAHTDGLIFGLLLALATGGAVIRPGPFSLAGFSNWIAMLRQHQATHMVTNPTVLSLIDRTADHTDYFAFESFRGILSSASQLRPELWERFEARFGTQIWNLYGLTETVTSALYAGRHPEMGPIGTLGKAVDCEAHLAPPQGAAPQTADTESGELLLRGPHIFRGYWRDPERTAKTFTADGWMRTGDLVRRNADGSFVFLGRVKAAINSGGTLIRGEEIDECLLRHPAVAEAVTVGVPDPEFEEIPVSAVVLCREADEVELTRHCRGELEQLKVPKRIVRVAAIPRGDAGKPNLQALRELLTGAVRPSAKAACAEPDPLEIQLIELASLVFRTDPQSLSLASTPATVKGWDSFTHVNLVLQAEDEFAVRISGSLIGKIKSLKDLHELISRLKHRAKAATGSEGAAG